MSMAISRFKEERPPGYGEWLLDRRNLKILKWWDEEMGKFNLNELRPKDIVNARNRIRRGEGRKKPQLQR